MFGYSHEIHIISNKSRKTREHNYFHEWSQHNTFNYYCMTATHIKHYYFKNNI